MSSMTKKSSSLLNRLKRAVQKVRLLLNVNIIKQSWQIANLFGRGSSSGLSKRHLSFSDRPGLMMYSDDKESEGEGSGSSARSLGLQRTTSCPSDQEDIDRRAELFIANFRRQLQMERQISLQLRYCRGNSFELISP